jgi:hypothetical protein
VYTTSTPSTLSRRELAMLRAVAAGRAETICSCEPDLFVDGLACCDQTAAHHLAHAGLVRASTLAELGQRVPAELTGPGRAVLATLANADWPTIHARTVTLDPPGRAGAPSMVWGSEITERDADTPRTPQGRHPGKQPASTEVTALRNRTTVPD